MKFMCSPTIGYGRLPRGGAGSSHPSEYKSPGGPRLAGARRPSVTASATACHDHSRRMLGATGAGVVTQKTVFAIVMALAKVT